MARDGPDMRFGRISCLIYIRYLDGKLALMDLCSNFLLFYIRLDIQLTDSQQAAGYLANLIFSPSLQFVNEWKKYFVFIYCLFTLKDSVIY